MPRPRKSGSQTSATRRTRSSLVTAGEDFLASTMPPQTVVESSKPKTEARKKRIPLGVPRMKLNAEQRPGYVRRWINDRPGRLHDAQLGGYEFVTSETSVGQDEATRASQMDSRVSRVVGTHEDGKPMIGYLMEIKKEFYDEDQEARDKRIDESERTIFRGKKTRNTNADTDGLYSPGGSSLESNVYQRRPSE